MSEEEDFFLEEEIGSNKKKNENNNNSSRESRRDEDVVESFLSMLEDEGDGGERKVPAASASGVAVDAAAALLDVDLDFLHDELVKSATKDGEHFQNDDAEIIVNDGDIGEEVPLDDDFEEEEEEVKEEEEEKEEKPTTTSSEIAVPAPISPPPPAEIEEQKNGPQSRSSSSSFLPQPSDPSESSSSSFQVLAVRTSIDQQSEIDFLGSPNNNVLQAFSPSLVAGESTGAEREGAGKHFAEEDDDAASVGSLQSDDSNQNKTKEGDNQNDDVDDGASIGSLQSSKQEEEGVEMDEEERKLVESAAEAAADIVKGEEEEEDGVEVVDSLMSAVEAVDESSSGSERSKGSDSSNGNSNYVHVEKSDEEKKEEEEEDYSYPSSSNRAVSVLPPDAFPRSRWEAGRSKSFDDSDGEDDKDSDRKNDQQQQMEGGGGGGGGSKSPLVGSARRSLTPFMLDGGGKNSNDDDGDDFDISHRSIQTTTTKDQTPADSDLFSSSTSSLSTSPSRSLLLQQYSSSLHQQVLQNCPPVASYILVAGFHHTRGAIVEWVYSKTGQRTAASDWGELPNLALPEGAHNVARDFVYFSVELHDEDDNDNGNVVQKSRYFGVACYEQIPTSQVVNREEHMTRTSVQKSVVLLSTEPYFGYLHCRLEAAARLYFSGKDFRQTEVLERLLDDLHDTKRIAVESLDIFQGLSAVDLLESFGERTLALLKLLLCEQRVIIYSPRASIASMLSLSLVSLLPSLLPSLSPAFHSVSRHLSSIASDSPLSPQSGASSLNASPLRSQFSIDDSEPKTTPSKPPPPSSSSPTSPSPPPSSQRKPTPPQLARVERQHGLPLSVFHRGCELLPYSTMFHLQNAKNRGGGFLMGSSNPWVSMGVKMWLPIIADATSGAINITNATYNITNNNNNNNNSNNSNSVNNVNNRGNEGAEGEDIKKIARLTAFERGFMQQLIAGVKERGGFLDKSSQQFIDDESMSVQFEGGNDWIRRQFRDYFLVFLRSCARIHHASNPAEAQAAALEVSRNYGASFYRQWCLSHNHTKWLAEHSEKIVRRQKPGTMGGAGEGGAGAGEGGVVADVKGLLRNTVIEMQPAIMEKSSTFLAAASSFVGSFWGAGAAKKPAASSKPTTAAAQQQLAARRAKVETLQRMGFSAPLCWEALESNNDHLERAAEWLAVRGRGD